MSYRIDTYQGLDGLWSVVLVLNGKTWETVGRMTEEEGKFAIAELKALINPPSPSCSGMVQLLWEKVEEVGTQKELAEQLGCSCQYLNDVLSCRRDFPASFAKFLGYEKVVVFQPLPEPAEVKG